MTLPTTDHTYGIDRNPSSPSYGRLVLGGKGLVPIMLWKKPGLPIKEENFGGALAHDTEVEVKHSKQYEGETWYYVKCDIVHQGKHYPQKGWLKAILLKDLGNGINNIPDTTRNDVQQA